MIRTAHALSNFLRRAGINPHDVTVVLRAKNDATLERIKAAVNHEFSESMRWPEDTLVRVDYANISGLHFRFTTLDRSR